MAEERNTQDADSTEIPPRAIDTVPTPINSRTGTVGASVASDLEFAVVAADIAIAKDVDNEAHVVPLREPTMLDFGLCSCSMRCDSKRCPCRKNDRMCDPRYCGCCSGIDPICLNIGSNPSYYRASVVPMPEVRPFVVGNDTSHLIIASWNVQSFGHNMYWHPDTGPKRMSRPFLAATKKIAEFITHHGVDLLFVQETMNPAALQYLIDQLNYYRLAWLPTYVDIGLGFNRSNPFFRPNELAAVIYKDSTKLSPPPPWSIDEPLTLCKHRVADLHEAISDLRDRFKRHPAYLTVNYGGELLCFVTLHLASDSGVQSLRLNAEVEALPDLAASLKESTGAQYVFLLGDFNRNPDTVAFTPLTATHYPSLLPKPTVRTNTGKKAHVYDNFFVPHEIFDRVYAAIGADEWMRIEYPNSGPGKLISDHYPVLLGLAPDRSYHSSM